MSIPGEDLEDDLIGDVGEHYESPHVFEDKPKFHSYADDDVTDTATFDDMMNEFEIGNEFGSNTDDDAMRNDDVNPISLEMNGA